MRTIFETTITGTRVVIFRFRYHSCIQLWENKVPLLIEGRYVEPEVEDETVIAQTFESLAKLWGVENRNFWKRILDSPLGGG